MVLVDWGRSGWYPEFWEFFSASYMFDMVYWEEDWCLRVGEAIDVYPAELAMMRMFDKDLGL